MDLSSTVPAARAPALPGRFGERGGKGGGRVTDISDRTKVFVRTREVRMQGVRAAVYIFVALDVKCLSVLVICWCHFLSGTCRKADVLISREGHAALRRNLHPDFQ